MFFQSTPVPVRTAVADIGRPGEGGTGLPGIVRAEKMAFGAEGAFLKTAGRIGAESGNRTVEAEGTVIKRAPEAASLFKNKMGADFF